MDDVKITIRDNGPYRVEGPITLVDADGTEHDLSARGGAVSLCRCGGSTTKPFCDGTHSRIGFDAATRAVQDAESTAPAATDSPVAADGSIGQWDEQDTTRQ